jgi:ABC-type transport system substrate-binding protein
MRRVAAAVLLVIVAAACSREEELTLRRGAASAKRGGTIVVAITEPSSIDPAAISTFDTSARLINETMCDRLVQFDTVSAAPVPSIAEAWLVANGGRTFTVKLRKGVRFSDGSEVTAEDVAYSFSRVAQAETASPVADVLRDVRGYEALHGEEDTVDDSDELIGVSVVDNYSFQIDLDESNADFVRVFGHALATPVPKRAAKANPEAFAGRPVCSGPYELAKPWEPNDETIRLVRNADYRATNLGYTGGGAGYADAIEFRIVGDAKAARAAYADGKVDVVAVPTSAEKGPDVVTATAPVLEYIGLPVNLPPYNDRSFRTALSLALDRTALIREVWGDGREPATGYLPPTLGRELYRGTGPCAKAAPARGNLSAARAAMASSGVPRGRSIPMRMSFNDEFANGKLAKAVAAQWQAAFPNLKITTAPSPWEPYLQTATSPTGFAGPFRMSWAPQYPSADGYITPLFDSRNAGRENLSRFSNGQFDRALEFDARRATGDADRAEMYQLMEDAACSQMPIVPIAFGRTHRLVRSAKLASASGRVTDLSSGEVVLRELFRSRAGA